jgi:hypothetical protein
MARRDRPPSTGVEKLVSHIYGINPKGDVARLAVYSNGRAVRLSGSKGSHTVHSVNAGSAEGWQQEAALIWDLTDVFDIPLILSNTPTERTRLEILRSKAAEKKQALNGVN